MKCTKIQLTHRATHFLPTLQNENENSTPKFKGEESHSYEFPFQRPKSQKPPKTSLKITNLNLPENIKCFNTGSSLDRWSKKRSRLKSAKSPKTLPEFDKDFCYETDLSLLWQEPEELKSRSGSLDNLQYEIHSDIEKLLETQSTRNEQKRKKKKKKKKKSKIKFSKASSPETDRVIRVDLSFSLNEEPVKEVEYCEKIDEGRKELKRNLVDKEEEEEEEKEDEDFVVKCRQLALRQRRRLR